MEDVPETQPRGSSPSGSNGPRPDEIFGSGTKAGKTTPSNAEKPKTPSGPSSGRVAASSSSATPIQLPPAIAAALAQVDDMSKKLEASRTRSRFNVVRSGRAFRTLSWTNPFLSFASLLVTTASYVSFYTFSSTLVGLASTLVVTALFISGAASAYNLYISANPIAGLPARLPTLALPINSGNIEGLFASIGSSIVSFLEKLNGHLSWQSPSESVKALGYAWLVMRFAPLLTPGWLLFYVLVGFVLAPAYLLNQPIADKAFTTQVLPQIKKASETIKATQQAALRYLHANQQVALIVGAVASSLILYFSWNIISISGLFTTAALTRAVLDVVLSVADQSTTASTVRND